MYNVSIQVSPKSGIWIGPNSSPVGAAEGPPRSVSHAASLDAISKRAAKSETTRVPCRSLTCSVCKYSLILDQRALFYSAVILLATHHDLFQFRISIVLSMLNGMKYLFICAYRTFCFSKHNNVTDKYNYVNLTDKFYNLLLFMFRYKLIE